MRSNTHRMRHAAIPATLFAAAFLFATCAMASYTRLEYIQGTGAQYINSGYTPASTEKSEATVRGGDGTIRFVTVSDISPTVISFR